ncbi:hypothetical protein OUZ56_017551 [Daphnia magna]|uniref:Uncharacterized protein n=1 Tax=Daphnia magna TaxID=35525 RepID=A0ABR0AT46_9CRUS|nr:hypothetical protein OUZ56_017551 [Daphnia magna]
MDFFFVLFFRVLLVGVLFLLLPLEAIFDLELASDNLQWSDHVHHHSSHLIPFAHFCTYGIPQCMINDGYIDPYDSLEAIFDLELASDNLQMVRQRPSPYNHHLSYTVVSHRLSRGELGQLRHRAIETKIVSLAKLPYGKTHIAIASTHRFNCPATMAIETLEATSKYKKPKKKLIFTLRIAGRSTYAAPSYYTKSPKYYTTKAPEYYTTASYYTTTYANPSYYTEAPKY